MWFSKHKSRGVGELKKFQIRAIRKGRCPDCRTSSLNKVDPPKGVGGAGYHCYNPECGAGFAIQYFENGWTGQRTIPAVGLDKQSVASVL